MCCTRKKLKRKSGQYLAEIYSEWKIFQTKVVDKIKTHVLCSMSISPNIVCLWDVEKNMVEPERPQVTLWRRFGCWISKATRTHTQKYVILIAFPRPEWFANAPLCYVIRTLSVLIIRPMWWTCKKTGPPPSPRINPRGPSTLVHIITNGKINIYNKQPIKSEICEEKQFSCLSSHATKLLPVQ